ncbi:MFS transporter [Telluria mixta]|uniref:MFS transporter n=1 Tax=Telluria mixta TaxID=34071 RepID=A0ABT2BRY6_9BURK|nr:MFS transporter [Telluria mixta]MCS0627877.1 MFS transporter [Telluria mixta]WEM94005.1 MFS transporter [Telluria mixta]
MIRTAKSFGMLYVATLLMQLGSTLLITWLALRLNAAGAAEFWVGALMAANALGMVFGGGVGRLLIGQVGHVRAYLMSGGVIVAALLGHVWSTALPAWLVLRLMVGMAMMCQLMVIESWLNERAENNGRGKVLAIYMVASYGGMMLGQLALGLDDKDGTLALPMVAMAFVLCFVPLVLTRIPPPMARAAAPVVPGQLVHGLSQAVLTVFVSGMLNGSFFGLSGVYAARQGMDTAAVGRYLALTVVAGVLAQLPLGLLSDRVLRITLIRGIAILLACVCLPLGIWQGPPQATLIAFSFAIGSLQFCLYLLGAGLANERICPDMRVPLVGMLLSVFGIGSCLGPLIAGALMTSTGASSLYYFFAGCAAVLAVVVGHTLRGDSQAAKDAPVPH